MSSVRLVVDSFSVELDVCGACKAAVPLTVLEAAARDVLNPSKRGGSTP